MSTRDNEDVTQDNSRTTTQETSPAVVLLADDEKDFRETLRLWLRNEERWDVREATTGEEALETLDDSVDLLVLDRRMPRLSGPEVLERLGEHTFDGNVVVVSAFEPDAHLNADMVAAYLTKPVTREEFLGALDRTL